MLRDERAAVRRCWPAPGAGARPAAGLRLVLDVCGLLAEEMGRAGGPATRLIEYRVPRETLRAHPPLVPAWRDSLRRLPGPTTTEEAAFAAQLRDPFHRP